MGFRKADGSWDHSDNETKECIPFNPWFTPQTYPAHLRKCTADQKAASELNSARKKESEDLLKAIEASRIRKANISQHATSKSWNTRNMDIDSILNGRRPQICYLRMTIWPPWHMVNPFVLKWGELVPLMKGLCHIKPHWQIHLLPQPHVRSQCSSK